MRGGIIAIGASALFIATTGCGGAGEDNAAEAMRDVIAACEQRGGVQAFSLDGYSADDTGVICKDGTGWVYEQGSDLEHVMPREIAR